MVHVSEGFQKQCFFCITDLLEYYGFLKLNFSDWTEWLHHIWITKHNFIHYSINRRYKKYYYKREIWISLNLDVIFRLLCHHNNCNDAAMFTNLLVVITKEYVMIYDLIYMFWYDFYIISCGLCNQPAGITIYWSVSIKAVNAIDIDF